MRVGLALLALWVVHAAAAAGALVTQTGSVRMTFSENRRSDLTAVLGTVYFESDGVGNRQQAIASFRQAVVIDAMPPGTYRLTVVAQSMTSVLVSSQVHEVTVTAGRVSAVPVDLVTRDGVIRIVDSAGSPIAGAHFYTSPSSVNSSADDDGQISLAMLAVGTALTVRTIQWGMTCHRVTAGDRQTVVVPDATEELVIVAPTTPTSGLPQRRVIVPSAVLTGAMVSGLPGADCAIPYEHFPVTMARAGGTTEHTMLLPFGEYAIRLLDGRRVPARAPGRVELR
jgi:hypothetical protein